MGHVWKHLSLILQSSPDFLGKLILSKYPLAIIPTDLTPNLHVEGHVTILL